MTEEVRTARLKAAGWNVMNLDPSAVEVDLMTDVPPRSYSAGIVDDTSDAEPDLAAAATAVYGPARYVFTTKGRSAELALGAALVQRGAVALAHPLFKTTQLSLTRPGATVEVIPTIAASSADVDLGWLERRLATSAVQLVCLEPGTNALGGLTLGLENVREARRLCQAHGALLVLDCARLIGNAERLSPGATLEHVQRFTQLADAFTVSCAKELRVPYGALVGVRDEALQRKVFAHAFDEGTLLEPLMARRALHAALVSVQQSTAPLARRRAQLERIALSLRGAGMPYREPLGGHAIYVPFAPELVAPPLHNRSLEGLLYRRSGIRSLLNPYPSLGGPHMRLALAVDRYSDATIATVGSALRTLIDRAADAPRLEDAAEAKLHDLFTRYRPRPESI